MTKIISVGYYFPGSTPKENPITVPFSSNKSLMDADFAIVSAEKGYDYDIQEGYSQQAGKTVYSQDGSGQIKEDMVHWKREIDSFLDTGKTIFLFLKEKEEFYLVNGFHMSGSGRTSVKNLHTELYDNYQFLPFDIGSIYNATGKEITGPLIPIFKTYHDSFKEMLSYESYITSDNGKAIYLTKNGNRKLGNLYNFKKGSLIVLPYLDFSDDKFSYTKNEENYWKKEALIYGEKLIQIFAEIDKNIRAFNTKTPPPNWIKSAAYLLKVEDEITTKTQEVENNVKKLTEEIKSLKEKLNLESEIKDLLFETGKPLENAVIVALKILGYVAERFNDGKLELDQVILSPEGDRFIGECEGKENKAIDIDKIRQLVDGLNEDLTREVVKDRAIGVLFGNPQRLENPENRKLNFTEKLLRTAEREKVALILTKDLFTVVKYLKENVDDKFKVMCRSTIKNSLGKIVIFPPIPLKTQ